MIRIVSRIALLAVQSFVFAFAFAVICVPVSAHAVLVSSSPADNSVVKSPPKQLVLHFNARIEKPVTQVTLFDSKGHKVALPAGSKGYSSGGPDRLIIPLPKLKPGAYRLEFQVLATDGHLSPGLLRFTVSGSKSP